MNDITLTHVRAGFYLDSVALMRISAAIKALPGVVEAALMIASPSNKQILAAAGLLAADSRAAIERAGPNDLVIGIRASDRGVAEQALATAAAALDQDGPAQDKPIRRPRSIAAAVSGALPGANLALISVPGEFAANETRKALRQGLNVMIFSDNVPIEQERSLKQQAREQGLLVMGPDCGTALLNGVPLAFANAVPRGEIGAIAASGTGLQEFSTLVARFGAGARGGLSHGIGVGGRDLSDAVGALATLQALDLLERDPATRRIVLLSKPPGAQTAARVIQRLRQCRKPVVACFLGLQEPLDNPRESANVIVVDTLRAAAEQAIGKSIATEFGVATAAPGGSQRKWLRGLFSGGTLCAEAQWILRQTGVSVTSNAPLPGIAQASAEALSEPVQAQLQQHIVLDLGADEYTVGRPHPMIAPQLRNALLAQALEAEDVAVVLLDVVLGYGAHADPAGQLATVIEAAPAERPYLIASVCGVEGDPQDYRAQVAKLEAVGVVVAPSNAHAAELASQVLRQR